MQLGLHVGPATTGTDCGIHSPTRLPCLAKVGEDVPCRDWMCQDWGIPRRAGGATLSEDKGHWDKGETGVK